MSDVIAAGARRICFSAARRRARFRGGRAIKSGDGETARETAMLNSAVATAALWLGEALLAQGTLPTAIGEFQRALRIDPSLEDARFGLGRAWLDAGEPEKALEAFRADRRNAPYPMRLKAKPSRRPEAMRARS